MSAPLPCPAPPADTCYLLLLRHGATANNEAHPPRIQGARSNESLSAVGRLQAEQAAELLERTALSAIYCSPLARAWETAEIVARPHRLTPRVRDALIECDVGQWEGRTWSQVQADDHAYFARFQHDPATQAYRGGENLRQVADRVTPVFDQLLAQHRGQIVAVVAHNVVNRAYLAELLGVPLAQARATIVQHNAGVSLVAGGDGASRVLMLNASWHLSHW